MPVSKRYEAVVIGVSAGGMNALKVILSQLPAHFGMALVIVQHRSHQSDDFLAHYLDGFSPLSVKEVDELEYIQAGVAYIAPANYHLFIEEDKTFSFSLDGPVNYARPSIDVLFEAAADAFGPKLIGLVLTGANNDGSIGLCRIKEQGGLAIVQDPDTAEVSEMPRAALEMADVDHVLQLEEIANVLARLDKE